MDCLAESGTELLPLAVVGLLVIGSGVSALLIARRRRGAASTGLLGLVIIGTLLGVGALATVAPQPASAASGCPPVAETPAPSPISPVPSPSPSPTPMLGSISGSVDFDQEPRAGAEEFCESYDFTPHGPVFLILSDPATGLVITSIQIHDPSYTLGELSLAEYGISISGTDLATGAAASSATTPTPGSELGTGCAFPEDGGGITGFDGIWQVDPPAAGTAVTLTVSEPDANLGITGSGQGGGGA